MISNVKQQLIYDLSHSIQTGVMLSLETDPGAGTSKHLRTGINIAMCDHAAVAGLLIEKGICTEDEYADAVIASYGKEVLRLEAELSAKYPNSPKITLR